MVAWSAQDNAHGPLRSDPRPARDRLHRPAPARRLQGRADPALRRGGRLGAALLPPDRLRRAERLRVGLAERQVHDLLRQRQQEGRGGDLQRLDGRPEPDQEPLRPAQGGRRVLLPLLRLRVRRDADDLDRVRPEGPAGAARPDGRGRRGAGPGRADRARGLPRQEQLPFGVFESDGLTSEYVFQQRGAAEFDKTGCREVCGIGAAEGM